MGVGSMLLRMGRYVVYERNPIVQIIYVWIMSSSYYFFVTQAHDSIPNSLVDGYHKWIVACLFVLCSGLYIYICNMDPGVIHADNVKTFTQYPNHPVLFPESKYCRTCKTPKLPRSKHCSVCNHCVARFDHHLLADVSCIWFNGCVGERNYKFFLLFLVIQLALCFYVFALLSSVFLIRAGHIIGQTSLSGEALLDAEMAAALQSVIARNQALGFVASVTLMIGLVVWLFIIMQLRRIALNTTANETFKRDDLYELAELDGATTGRRMFSFLMKQLGQKDKKLTQSRAEKKKDLDSSWGGMFSPDLIMNTEESYSVEDVKFNPYNLGGFWKNLQDALQLKSRASALTTKKKGD